ncbi:hypothetical protein WJX72_011831 [[Myrmecia] bisecta]|uniref:DNA-directed RNA polymerase subunit beta n=1 Tax=[Myrmecia] bisecta TaxID=41462 RepID=A0AAW1QT37_9CHLO
MQRGLVQGNQVPQEYEDLVQPHVQSFDYFLSEGLHKVVERLEPLEIEHPVTKTRHRFWFESPVVGRPLKEDVAAGADARLFPRDCREGGATYKAPLHIDLCYQVEGGGVQRMNRRLGHLPIMVKSKGCYLRNLSRSQLVKYKEESTEMGGYFICNGIERIIRMLILQRRHYIMALNRSAYRKRGNNYTESATLIRCVQPDETSATVRCHYLTDGAVNFAFTIRRAEYFIPAGVLLKCFLQVSDRELYDKLVTSAPQDEGNAESSFVAERAELLLRQAASTALRTRAQCIEWLGSHFRVVLDRPPRHTDYQVGEYLLANYVFIHLEQPGDKLGLLIAMLHKLYALVSGLCCEDNPDALTHHEILLPGHLLQKFMKDKLEEALGIFKEMIKRDLDKAPENVNLQDETYIKRSADKMPDLGKKVEYMLNTGNLVSRSGLDLSQATGFTVVAEKLNFFRYLSHFRSVHRGAYFAELRTTTVRKLLPESWGFLCPVHTPDGSPCGLLNHFTAVCKIVTDRPENPEDTDAAIIMVLAAAGMTPSSPALVPPPPPVYLTVMLDGRVVGWVRSAGAPLLVNRLRAMKSAKLALEQAPPPDASVITLEGAEGHIPSHVEIAYIPYERGGVYPGVYLFTQCARMVRPVKQIRSRAPELIGSLEQFNMSIRCPDGGAGGSKGLKFTHAEFNTGAMLSVVASLTPWSDYNQSPRNMYQCQMGKQTMGTPCQAFPHRTDGKMYRIQTPQTPIARTKRYDTYKMDEFPNGTNAIVAVLAYTGYDMEDAMILNKSSMERGLAHATLLKTETIDLRAEKGKQLAFGSEAKSDNPHDRGSQDRHFRPQGAFGQRFPQNVPSFGRTGAVEKLRVRPQGAHKDSEQLDVEGLPHVGAIIWPGQPYYNAVDKISGRSKGGKLKGEETGVIDQVTLIGSKEAGLTQANIKMRLNRNPVIGDKFSSRHGQKGVLSQLWPDTDMPFVDATGMRPDLIINPHAFPSRMTIGMLVESMASKAGALAGHFVDASPFQRSDGKRADPINEFGAALEAAGFARHGGETMISGITGEEFAADIYIGPVYYQRLRHMVSDKFQVRSTGPVNPLTRQPIKGRKFGGGIRFGEMERDSLLAHGAAYLLHDRLHTCSDYSVMEACGQCGSLLSPISVPQAATGAFGAHITGPLMEGRGAAAPRVACKMCKSAKHVERVALPYVFRYLVTELAAMNIKCSLTLK